MVAETRAETAPGQRGAEPGRGGLPPPVDGPVIGEDGVSGPLEEVFRNGWIPLAETFRAPSTCSDRLALGWTGGGGARLLTLGDGEQGAFSPGPPDGTGGAGAFTDLRLGPEDPDDAGGPEGGGAPRGTEGRSVWLESSGGGPQPGPASPRAGVGSPGG